MAEKRKVSKIFSKSFAQGWQCQWHGQSADGLRRAHAGAKNDVAKKQQFI